MTDIAQLERCIADVVPHIVPHIAVVEGWMCRKAALKNKWQKEKENACAMPSLAVGSFQRRNTQTTQPEARATMKKNTSYHDGFGWFKAMWQLAELAELTGQGGLDGWWVIAMGLPGWETFYVYSPARGAYPIQDSSAQSAIAGIAKYAAKPSRK